MAPIVEYRDGSPDRSWAYIDGDGSVICADCATQSEENEDEIPKFRPREKFSVFFCVEGEACDQCSCLLNPEQEGEE